MGWGCEGGCEGVVGGLGGGCGGVVWGYGGFGGWLGFGWGLVGGFGGWLGGLEGFGLVSAMSFMHSLTPTPDYISDKALWWIPHPETDASDMGVASHFC